MSCYNNKNNKNNKHNKNIYQDCGTSIYTPPCDLSPTQLLFGINQKAYHYLDLATRKQKRNDFNRKTYHGKRVNRTLSHAEIMNIQKSQAYNNPKSFRKLKRSSTT